MFWGVVLGCWLAILLASACARQSRDQRRRLTDLAAVGLILLIALIRLAEPFDTVMGRGQGFGLPVEGIALVAGVDRIFDMGRTTVNITGDAACAICVSEMERKKAKA